MTAFAHTRFAHTRTAIACSERRMSFTRQQPTEPQMTTPRIEVEYVYPPVPFRDHDWRATFPDSYEPGGLTGYGPTKQSAIDDLLSQVDELDESDTGSAS